MEYISFYLGQHKKQDILYFFGSGAKTDSLIKTLSISSYKDFVIVLEDSTDGNRVREELLEELDDKLVKNLSFRKISDDLSSYRKYTFVLDHYVSEGDLLTLTKYTPEEIIGLQDGWFNTFSIWEKYRLFAKKFSIARDLGPLRNEIFDWQKDENSDIELSVVLPVYNVAKYLDKCIETVCEWDAPYVEFLFVNDGSPDNSREIILEYAKKDPRIKLLDKENGGCASAREYGFNNAKGRYIGLIDPDDFIDPKMFKYLLSRALVGSYDIAYCGYNEYYESTKESQEVEEPYDPIYEAGTSERKFIDKLIAYQRIAIWREIFRKDFIVENDLHFHTDIKRHDDLPFKIETYAKAKSVAMVNKNMYYYRLGRPGQDVSATDKRLFVHFDIFKHVDEFFKKNPNSRQEDYYHIAKVQTHHWVTTKIDSDCVNEYLLRASIDLGIKNTKASWKKELKKCFRKKEVKLFFNSLKQKKAKFIKGN